MEKVAELKNHRIWVCYTSKSMVQVFHLELAPFSLITSTWKRWTINNQPFSSSNLAPLFLFEIWAFQEFKIWILEASIDNRCSTLKFGYKRRLWSPIYDEKKNQQEQPRISIYQISKSITKLVLLPIFLFPFRVWSPSLILDLRRGSLRSLPQKRISCGLSFDAAGIHNSFNSFHSVGVVSLFVVIIFELLYLSRLGLG